MLNLHSVQRLKYWGWRKYMNFQIQILCWIHTIGNHSSRWMWSWWGKVRCFTKKSCTFVDIYSHKSFCKKKKKIKKGKKRSCGKQALPSIFYQGVVRIIKWLNYSKFFCGSGDVHKRVHSIYKSEKVMKPLQCEESKAATKTIICYSNDFNNFTHNHTDRIALFPCSGFAAKSLVWTKSIMGV